jgi:hypothetical protein
MLASIARVTTHDERPTSASTWKNPRRRKRRRGADFASLTLGMNCVARRSPVTPGFVLEPG